MASNRLRLLLTVVVTLAVATTALAQRGGGFFRPSYSANTRYDGKFVFVRMSYPWNGFRTPAWAHDYPTGEVHFMKILTAVSNVTAHVEETNILDFGDPEMFKYPVIYLCEPGYWQMDQNQVKALRDYFLKGGFMIVDDFPSWAWGQFDLQMSQVFPEGRWIDLDVNHPIWHTFFDDAAIATESRALAGTVSLANFARALAPVAPPTLIENASGAGGSTVGSVFSGAVGVVAAGGSVVGVVVTGGTTDRAGTTLAGSEPAPSPLAFRAETVTVYDSPFVSPAITQDVAGALTPQLIPPGSAVAV